MAIQHSLWRNEQEITPQAWARGPDFLMLQPCVSAYFSASRICLLGWSPILLHLLAVRFFDRGIIP